MYESYKLSEATFFLENLRLREEGQMVYSYYLSAFLSAARSVLQYALKEAREKPGGREWYDSEMNTSPLLSFLKQKRDTGIHHEPVLPMFSIQTGDQGRLFELATVTEHLEDGSTLVRQGAAIPAHAHEGPIPTFINIFQNWPGPESVTDLCAQYLETLYGIVARGASQGYINP